MNGRVRPKVAKVRFTGQGGQTNCGRPNMPPTTAVVLALASRRSTAGTVGGHYEKAIGRAVAGQALLSVTALAAY